MEDGRRNHIALAIFFVLIIAGGLILGAYFLTGRSWTVAATFVDDTVGNLEDYDVVLFKGTLEPVEDVGASKEDASPENTMEDAFNTKKDMSREDGIAEKIISTYQRADKVRESGSGPLYVSDVRDLYELKGADAITLNLEDIGSYSSPTILRAGDTGYGIISIPTYISRAMLSSMVKELRREGALNVMLIAPRLSQISTYDGVDVAILTSEDGAGSDGVNAGDTLIVQSPAKDEVGVVLFSSNNVPSFKTVKAL